MISPERYTRIANSALFSSDTNYGPLVTGSATPHAKGSWVSLIAALGFDGWFAGIQISELGLNATDSSALVDIGIDPAGGTSYTVVIPNILSGGAAPAANMIATRWFPVFIPKGSQIAARLQGLQVSDVARVGITVYGGDGLRLHRGEIQDYGTNTADSGGVKMANAAVNTKGAWTQLGADTTRRHSGLVVMASCATATAANQHFIDVGIDPAGGTTYSIVIPEFYVGTDGNETVFLSTHPSALVGIDIPAGAAIAARSQSTGSSTNDHVEVAAYGF